MRSIMMKCPKCLGYTLQQTCPKDGETTRMTIPVRYSPDDRYAKYRRALMEQLQKGRSENAGH